MVMAENGKATQGVAQAGCSCSIDLLRGLPVGGYFVLYQWNIQRIQRRRLQTCICRRFVR